MILQVFILMRSTFDLISGLVKLLPTRKPLPDLIPAYRLVTKEELFRRRAERAIDITPRWPLSVGK